MPSPIIMAPDDIKSAPVKHTASETQRERAGVDEPMYNTSLDEVDWFPAQQLGWSDGRVILHCVMYLSRTIEMAGSRDALP